MVGEGGREERLRGAAIAAPGAAELEQRRALERVDFGAPRLLVGVLRIHFSAAAFRLARPVSKSRPTILSISMKRWTILKKNGVSPCIAQVTTVPLSFGCSVKSTVLCA